MRRVDEQEALEVLLASLDVKSHEWLEERTGQDERTPDLRLKLVSGREVFVEVIQHTYSAQRHLFTADGTEVEAEELRHSWKLVVSDPSASDVDRQKSLPIRPLLDKLVPVLQSVESCRGTSEEMKDLGTDFIWRVMQEVDADLPAMTKRRVRVAEVTPASDGGRGSIKVHVTTGFGIALESVDELVTAVQTCIDKKHARGQGADWLVVALDGTRASQQLEEAFDRGSDSSTVGAQDLSSIDLRGFEEVWGFARSFNGQQHILLRFTGSGATWERRVIARASR